MYTPTALLDLHTRSHSNLTELLTHCRLLSSDEINSEIDGFGYPTIQLQIHHIIGAQKYWIGVLQGRMDVDDDAPDFPSIETLERFREQVFADTESYLRAATEDELNTARTMMTWGNNERVLVPAHVFVRTFAHIYHHMGQVTAMCRLLGKPCQGIDFPIT